MKQQVKITSDGNVTGTKVIIDGVDISSSVQAVTWTMDAANPSRVPHVVLWLTPMAEVDIEGEMTVARTSTP